MKDNKPTQQSQENQPASPKQGSQQQSKQPTARNQATDTPTPAAHQQNKGSKQPVSQWEQSTENNDPQQSKPTGKQTRQPKG